MDRRTYLAVAGAGLLAIGFIGAKSLYAESPTSDFQPVGTIVGTGAAADISIVWLYSPSTMKVKTCRGFVNPGGGPTSCSPSTPIGN